MEDIKVAVIFIIVLIIYSSAGKRINIMKTHDICFVEQSKHSVTRTLCVSIQGVYSLLRNTKCVCNIMYQFLTLEAKFSLLVILREQKSKYYRSSPSWQR